MTLEIVPVKLRNARRFVIAEHRHAGDVRGWLFGAALIHEDGEVRGVAIASRPTGRGLDDGRTVEIIRCCTLGDKNACSRLYGALCRAAKALGYRRAVTYTLESETGASVAAAGFVRSADLPARGYGGGRHRYDENVLGEQIRPEEAKVRWERALVRSRVAT